MTAGDRKTELNKAAVKALRQIGQDDGTKDDPNAKFKVELAQRPQRDQVLLQGEAARRSSAR